MTQHERLAEQLAKVEAALRAKQVDLDPKAKQVLDENLWELYE